VIVAALLVVGESRRRARFRKLDEALH